jgi:hypothetical protein
MSSSLKGLLRALPINVRAQLRSAQSAAGKRQVVSDRVAGIGFAVKVSINATF